jgi:hypothetical protein
VAIRSFSKIATVREETSLPKGITMIQPRVFSMVATIILVAAGACSTTAILKEPAIPPRETKRIETVQLCEAGDLLAFKPSHGLLLSKAYIEPSVRSMKIPVVIKEMSRSCRDHEEENNCLSTLVDETLENLTPALKSKGFLKLMSCGRTSVYTWLDIDGQSREQRFSDDGELAAFLWREQGRGHRVDLRFYRGLTAPGSCTAHVYILDIEKASSDCVSEETLVECRSRVQKEVSKKRNGGEIRVRLQEKHVVEAILLIDGNKIRQQFPDFQSVERHVEILKKQGHQATCMEVTDNARIVHAAQTIFTRYEDKEARVAAIRIRWSPDQQKPGVFRLNRQSGDMEPVALTSEERQAQIEELRDKLGAFIVLSFQVAPDDEISTEVGCPLPKKQEVEPSALNTERMPVQRMLPENWVIQRGENIYRVTHSAREILQDDISILGVGTTVVPFFSSGAITGTKLLMIEPGSPLLDLGLKENDVVYSINSIPLTSPDSFLDAFWEAKKQNTITVEIGRGSNRLVLTYELYP